MSETPQRTAKSTSNRAAMILVVLALTVTWFTGAWWWYSCHIKNLCGNYSGTTPPASIEVPVTTPPETGDQAACAPYITSPILVGAANDPKNVVALQTFLNRFEKARLNIDGKYSNRVVAAVKKFQLKHKNVILAPYKKKTPSGNVDMATMKEINDLFCGITPHNLKG